MKKNTAGKLGRLAGNGKVDEDPRKQEVKIDYSLTIQEMPKQLVLDSEVAEKLQDVKGNGLEEGRDKY